MRIQAPSLSPSGVSAADFSPLRPHAPIPLFPDWAIYAFTAGVILFAVWLFWIMRGGASKGVAEKKVNPLNAAIEALRELEKRAPDMGARAYSSAVSDILRGYIEQACALPAQEQTSEEFLLMIQGHPIFDAKTQQSLEEFFELCDLAKFAQQAVEAEEKERLLKQARELIETLYRSMAKHKMEAQKGPSSLPKGAAAPA